MTNSTNIPSAIALSVLWMVLLLTRSTAVAQESSDVLQAAAQRSPAAATVLEMPREEPADAITVVLTLFNLGEHDAAAEVLKQTIASESEDAKLARVATKLGAARLLRLAGAAGEEQLPGAREFVEKCLAAAAKQAADPQRLTKLIGDLSAENDETRVAARHDLAATGLPAAEACLSQLATVEEPAVRTQLLLTLAEMSPLVDPLLIAALDQGRGRFQRDIAELAGHLHLRPAIPWLTTLAAGGTQDTMLIGAAQTALLKMGLPLPDESDAIALVRREIERLESGIATDPRAAEDTLWWSWSPENKRITSQELPLPERRSLALARLSKNFLELPGSPPEDRLVAVVTVLEAASLLDGSPTAGNAELVASLSSEEISSALDLALQTRRSGAAVACINLLAKRKADEAFTSFTGQPRPLVRAVRNGNPEVQFAALKAIMELDPQQSFAGASFVAPALWNVAAGAGTRQAVVGAPAPVHAEDWAGMLRSLGYDATPATSGIGLVQAALAAPRLEIILVDSDIGRPLVREVLFQLRSQPQMAKVPVAILCANPDLELGRDLAEKDDRLLAVSLPHSDEAMKSLVTRLVKLSSQHADAEERLSRASQALEWIGHLLATGGPCDELLRGADVLEQTVYRPMLTKPSLAAMAVAGTADSQGVLADFASQATQPVEMRRLAAEEFNQSVQTVGCLLTAEEIVRQYDRYNASEAADADTQEILGQILDALEGKASAASP